MYKFLQLYSRDFENLDHCSPEASGECPCIAVQKHKALKILKDATLSAQSLDDVLSSVVALSCEHYGFSTYRDELSHVVMAALMIPWTEAHGMLEAEFAGKGSRIHPIDVDGDENEQGNEQS